ncbi:F23N19.20 [Arabidopsis thaliana]|uniref:F23N19.20 n=1 Tax=Arabidopsis thaliana TaxID=3702 RepID=Q9SI66_ARATH|nr:F23N19.20 [Arabidopsis thaliana]
MNNLYIDLDFHVYLFLVFADNVTLNFARSGGPGGQNVNKCMFQYLYFSLTVNTKVDMRFNVKNAYWLSDRIREKILLTEKNRINKDGELVISSTKTRTQNAAKADNKRLKSKKVLSDKKSARRSRGSYDD